MAPARLPGSLTGVLLICALLAGCAAIGLGKSAEKPKPTPPPLPPSSDQLKAEAAAHWTYAAGALRLAVDSDAGLNPYAGQGHSLVLAVLQTADQQAFFGLLKAPPVVEQLLQGGTPPPGLIQVDRFAIEPGRQTLTTLDRAEGARFVGVVAAYFSELPEQTAQLFAWPLTVTKTGLMFKDYHAEPAPAELRLTLGPTAIVRALLVTVPGPGAVAAGVAAPTPASGAVPIPATVATNPIELNRLDDNLR